MKTMARGGLSTRQRLFRVLAAGEAGVVLALIIICVGFQLLEPAFSSSADVRAILSALSYLGIISVGQVILLVGGEFDLSVGSTAGLARHHVPVALSIIIGAGVGRESRSSSSYPASSMSCWVCATDSWCLRPAGWSTNSTRAMAEKPEFWPRSLVAPMAPMMSR